MSIKFVADVMMVRNRAKEPLVKFHNYRHA